MTMTDFSRELKNAFQAYEVSLRLSHALLTLFVDAIFAIDVYRWLMAILDKKFYNFSHKVAQQITTRFSISFMRFRIFDELKKHSV